MSRKSDKTSSNKNRLVFLVVFIGLLGSIMAVSYLFKISVSSPAKMFLNDADGKMQEVFSSPIRKLKILWENYVELRHVKTENQYLKTQIMMLQRELTAYREAQLENLRLKQLLNIKKKLSQKSVTANIIGFDLATWRAVVTINAGKSQGIRRDMPVVVPNGGVLGKVMESSIDYSKVMLLTDYHSRIAALVQRNRVRGILKGLGREGCSLDYVKKDADIQVGDTIITSGMDGIFPKGLLLGTVSKVGQGDPTDLFQTIRIKPAADLDHVEEVLVILTRPLEGN